MVEKKIKVTMKNGTVYEKTIRTFDTCEEYYDHVSERQTDELRSMQKKVRKVDRNLDGMYREREFEDDFDDVRRFIESNMKHNFDFDEF